MTNEQQQALQAYTEAKRSYETAGGVTMQDSALWCHLSDQLDDLYRAYIAAGGTPDALAAAVKATQDAR